MTGIWVVLNIVATQGPVDRVGIDQELPLSVTRKIGKVDTKVALEFLSSLTKTADNLTNGYVTSVLSRADRTRAKSQKPTGVYNLWIFPKDTPEVVGVTRPGTSLGAVFSVATGRVVRFAFGAIPGNPQYTIEQCRERAEVFYRAAGGKHRLGEPFVETYASGGASDASTVDFLFDQIIPNSHYPIGGRIQAIMNRTTGLPQSFEMSWAPDLEPATKIAAPLKMNAVAAQLGMEVTGWSSVKVGSTGPRYEVPAYLRVSNGLTFADRLLVSKGMAKLVQEFSVCDASSFDPKGRRYRRFVQVVVDAQTARPLAVMPVYLMQGAGGKEKIAVAISGKSWTLGGASGTLKLIGEAGAPTGGKVVGLRSGVDEWIFPTFRHGRWYLDGKVYSANPVITAVASSVTQMPKFTLNPPAVN